MPEKLSTCERCLCYQGGPFGGVTIVISCIEEKDMQLSVFYYCICTFLCRCHGFNPSLCHLLPFLLSYVAMLLVGIYPNKVSLGRLKILSCHGDHDYRRFYQRNFDGIRSQLCYDDFLGYVQTDTTTPNIVGPTILGVVVSICMWLKVLLVSNFAQQLPTTCNRVCKQIQHVTSNNVGSSQPTMLHPFAWGFSSTN